MVLILLGGVVMMGLAAQKGGSPQAMMHATAADNAARAFLKGERVQDSVGASALTSNCREYYEYSTAGTIASKVKKCTTLG